MRKIGVDPTVIEVRHACYLLSSDQIDAALAQMERPTLTTLPRHLTVGQLRQKISSSKLRLRALSLEWMTMHCARVCHHRVNPKTGARVLRSPAVDYDGTWLNPDPMCDDDILSAADALEVTKAVAKKAGSIADVGWKPRRMDMPTLGVLHLSTRVSLASAAQQVIREARDPPMCLLQAVANMEDFTEDQVVLRALMQASQSAASSRGASRVTTLLNCQAMTVLSVIASKFNVLLLMPRGTYMDYSHVSAAALPSFLSSFLSSCSASSTSIPNLRGCT